MQRGGDQAEICGFQRSGPRPSRHRCFLENRLDGMPRRSVDSFCRTSPSQLLIPESPSAVWVKINELPAGNCSTCDNHHSTPSGSITIHLHIVITKYKITGSSSLSPRPPQIRAKLYSHVCRRRSRSPGSQSCRAFTSPKSEPGSLWLMSSTCSASSPANHPRIRCEARVRSITRFHH